MRSRRAEGKETAKNAKTSNLQYVLQKTPIFQDPKTCKIDKNLEKMHAKNEARTKVTLQKRFFMILPPFWRSPGSSKAPKNSQKRGVKKRSKKGS